MPDSDDWIRAYDKHRDTLRYTTDALLLALAEDLKMKLVTFDREFIEHGAVAPETYL